MFDNYFLLCTQDGQCLAFDHQNAGKSIWQWKNENPIIAGACVHNGNLIITDIKSIVTKLTSSNGTVLDQVDLQISETFSTPVIYSDCIYIGSRDDHLYCFRMQ